MMIDMQNRLFVICLLLIAANSVMGAAQWNGGDSSSAQRGAKGSSLTEGAPSAGVAEGVDPKDYNKKEDFLRDYLAQEIDRLSAEQRSYDHRTLGGEQARKRRIRKSGEKLWEDRNRVMGGSTSKMILGTAEEEVESIEKYLNGKPLDGLFGMSFGPLADLSKYERIGNSNTYRFVPKKKFRTYATYVFSVTPISKQVYGIRAAGFVFGSDPAEGDGFIVRNEWDALKAALEKRYAKVAQIDVGTQVCPNFRLLFPDGNEKRVGRKIEVVFGSSITAVDVRLKKLAEDESEILRRKALDEKAAEDIEAL